MTLQILKDNRQEIINEIISIIGNDQSDIKAVMTEMVNMIGWNGIRSTNAIDYVKEVMEVTGIGQEIILSKGSKASNWIENNNRERNIKLMKTI